MPSIKDIAARAQVSIGTVDRVLHNRGRVSAETKARVEQIIRKLGYRPNIHARNLSLDKAYRFGIVLPRLSQDSGYWNIPMMGIERAGRELQVYKVHLRSHYFDRYSERSFERALRDALGAKPDGLLIAPVLPQIAQKLIPAIPGGIPFVFIDSMIPGTECLSFIGQDPYQSGLLAAGLMLKSVRNGRSVAIVKVMPEDFHITERIRGFLSGLRDSPQQGARVYEVDSHKGEKAFAGVVELMLRENKNLGGVFVSNAWTHSVARLVNALPDRERVSLIGYDLVEKNLRALERNAVDFLISQRPEMQGYEGVYCLYEHVVLREPVKRKIMVPIDILTRDNVQYYQDYTREELWTPSVSSSELTTGLIQSAL
ncbi:MAG: LacI family DNA-binding transcriptional regulator [Ignavibacteriales bacterium]|nr:LacI family DNA-binding transcriptional regulator [Ignavibacteriales bacterium]